MQRYQCHKIVEATKVYAAERLEDGAWKCSGGDGHLYTLPAHNKITEEDTGYVVRYSDGYQSWSPTKAFEEGYTFIGIEV